MPVFDFRWLTSNRRKLNVHRGCSRTRRQIQWRVLSMCPLWRSASTAQQFYLHTNATSIMKALSKRSDSTAGCAGHFTLHIVDLFRPLTGVRTVLHTSLLIRSSGACIPTKQTTPYQVGESTSKQVYSCEGGSTIKSWCNIFPGSFCHSRNTIRSVLRPLPMCFYTLFSIRFYSKC